MKRTLNISVTAKERDYLVRLLLGEQEVLIRTLSNPFVTRAYARAATKRAEEIGEMAERIASTVKRNPTCTS